MINYFKIDKIFSLFLLEAYTVDVCRWKLRSSLIATSCAILSSRGEIELLWSFDSLQPACQLFMLVGHAVVQLLRRAKNGEY